MAEDIGIAAALADPAVRARVAAAIAPPPESDGFTRRARPGFLYVMYLLLLWSIPLGVLAAFDRGAADAVVRGMAGYFAAIPEPLYALFGTGYLGYTAARQWGKARGSDR